ncbi:LacI family DNA-binding transcriptional regulator [Christiangramia forsetii]|uniref:LacI family transcriptional regulator protein n=2 Tax=Christiangramia forsetii TaxID=411153 RepID=A0M313_CHRFK|nr:LacI family DNA-binding transcriptional regulator [Christiangramia forsetii]GGG27028.1 LacI family transcriptional regulator [Christiangramia forsetii]CAL67008.1 LacI family transcriptional regulator protein [Christiangramia forsetii KT0803]
MKSKITLKELAKLLNVSISTVSKALHDSSEISPKTAKRVKELASLHNYRPNPVAVNLKKSRTGTIGVVIPNISNSFFARVLSGMEAEAQKHDQQIITYISNESFEREKQICDMLTSGMVDGVLIAVSEETQKKQQYDHLFALLDYDIPVVIYDRINLGLPADKIGVDDEKSFFDATKFFRAKGLEKIGLASAIHHVGIGQLRIKGYKKALKDEGAAMMATSTKPDDLKKKIRDLITEKKIEALLCTDFESAIMATRIAYEEKINIPEDLKLIGYISREIAEFLTPSLSYIEQHPQELGSNAIEILNNRLDGKYESGKFEEKIIATTLIHLESTKF